MRGKPLRSQTNRTVMRITPAGAGKTALRHSVRIKCRDHPRRCGENPLTTALNDISLGSPPQVRGKRNQVCVVSRRNGITPAGAGKTSSVESQPSEAEDHPRRCGENSISRGYTNYNRGSPPQVRGKPSSGALADAAGGITPAGAGKTIIACAYKGFI